MADAGLAEIGLTMPAGDRSARRARCVRPARWWRALVCALFSASVLAGLGVCGPEASADDRLASDHGASTPRVADDRNRPIYTRPAALRVIALAPHLTDLVVALGAASSLVAVDPHSELPPSSASRVARVPAYPAIDPERLLSLKPDLILVWGEGLSAAVLARLEAFGLRVFVSQPRTLEDVANSLERIGSMIEAALDPRAVAASFRGRLDALSARHARQPRVPVFVQLWEVPLTTVGARSVMADTIARCGVRQVFEAADTGSQRVSPEAVLAAAPRLIISTVRGSSDRRWRQMGLVGEGPDAARFIRVEDAALERPSPPVLDALERLCLTIDAALPRGR